MLINFLQKIGYKKSNMSEVKIDVSKINSIPLNEDFKPLDLLPKLKNEIG